MSAFLRDLRTKVEAGEQLDYKQLARLQAIDTALAAHEFMEAANEREVKADDDFEAKLATN